MASFVTLAEVKEWLNITKPDFDSILTTINDAMCQAVVNYVGHDFTDQIVTNEVIDASQSDQVIPQNSPIQSVQALYFHTRPDGSQGNLIDPIDYQVTPEGISLQNFHTPFRRSRIRIDYTWGYSTLPADVKLLMLQAVEAEYRRRGQKSLGVSSRSKKDESQSFTNDSSSAYWDPLTGLPTELKVKLNFYKPTFEWPSSPMAQSNL